MRGGVSQPPTPLSSDLVVRVLIGPFSIRVIGGSAPYLVCKRTTGVRRLSESSVSSEITQLGSPSQTSDGYGAVPSPVQPHVGGSGEDVQAPDPIHGGEEGVCIGAVNLISVIDVGGAGHQSLGGGIARLSRSPATPVI